MSKRISVKSHNKSLKKKLICIQYWNKLKRNFNIEKILYEMFKI